MRQLDNLLIIFLSSHLEMVVVAAVRVAAAQSGSPGVTACSTALQGLGPGHGGQHILQGAVLRLVHLVTPEGAVDVNPLTEAEGEEAPGDTDTLLIIVSVVSIAEYSAQNTLTSVTT